MTRRLLAFGIAAAVIVAVAAVVLLREHDPAGTPPVTAERDPAGTPAAPERDPAGTPTAPERCRPQESVAIQGGEHLIGDAQPPVPYNSSPPTSGWHSSGAFDIAVQPPGDPLSEPLQVSVLEAGGVVITYRGIPDDERRALEDLVRDRFAGRAAVTTYESIAPGEVAMTSWGVLQRCQGFDAGAVAAFVEAHADPDPSTH